VICLDNLDPCYSPARKRANLRDALASGRVELVEGDVRDGALCRELVAGRGVSAVVHLAARAGVRPSIEEPATYEEVNGLGTVNVLEAVRLAGGVERLVFGSSSSVYGLASEVPFREDAPVARPISPYAATKRAGELICHVYHHLYGVSVACLRFFTVYGPRQRPDLAIHKFTRLIAGGEPIPVFGDGTTSRDYTHVSDVVEGIVAALARPLEFEIFNLGSSNPVELRELIGLIETALGREARVDRQPEQPGDVPITYADVSKARRLLGYAPRVPIGRGIEEFVEWFRDARPPAGQ
jgi:UDP-glucuronate 4-epimerase